VPASITEKALSVHAKFPDRQPVGQEVEVVAVAVVETPFPHEEVGLLTLGPDDNAGDNRHSVLIRAVPATRKAGWRWDLVLGLGTAAVLALAFVVGRRRRA